MKIASMKILPIKILHRHIAKSILMSTALVMLLVTAIIFFIGLLTELRDIGIGDYSFMQALIHEILRLPLRIYQFFPMCILIGGMMGLGLLASQRELMVMRASGLSLKQIIIAVMIAAFILIFIAMMMGEGFAPQANYIAQTRKDIAQSKGQAVATVSGLWMHEGNNFLHIDRVVGKTHLEGVTRYEFDTKHHLLAAYYAKTLDFQNGQWIVHDLVKTIFANDKTSNQKFSQTTWDLKLNPNHLNVGYIEPEEMSLRGLQSYVNHLRKNQLQSVDFEFMFWKRILQPFATLIMILLALPFVMNSSRSVNMGWQITQGVIIGFVFYMLNAFLSQMSIVFQLPAFAAAAAPVLLFAIVSAVVLRRVK